ncbi:MAG: gliding motility-associated C-terminal domain-containing protein [Flavobacterium sp.]|nr:gliding motility-associated C-terminal domain-containing protein [Flavobacterium sp.]
MKKLLLLFMSLWTFTSFAQLNEGFEGGIPSTWAVFDNGIGTANSWTTTSNTAVGWVFAGANSAFINRENVAAGNNAVDWLVTSQVTVPANGQVRFFGRQTLAGNNGTSYSVRVSTTSQTDPNAFTTVATFSETDFNDSFILPGAFEQKSIPLNAYVGQDVFIAFVMTGATTNGDRWVIDNVIVDQQCLVNTNLQAAPQATSALLSWTSSSSGPWEVEYGPEGFTQGTGTVVIATTNVNFNLNPPLDPLTDYSYYVRSICSPGNNSPWSEIFDFTTSALPPECGGNFVDTGGPSANYASNEDYTIVICPDNPGDFVTVTFTSFFTEASFDKLYVYDGNSTASPQISSGNGGGFGPVTLPGAFWGNLNANLPGPFEATSASGCLTFRFVSDGIINNPGWTANITCEPFPSCPKPTNLTSNAISASSIVVNWTNNAPSASAWQIIWLPAGSPAPAATLTTPAPNIAETTDPATYTITGLDSQTAYDIYVRAICDSGSDIGPWSTVNTTAETQPNYCAGDNFYDPGGPNGNYPNNSNVTTTICPETPGEVVTVFFNSFNLVSSIGDTLTIYDGDSTSGTPVGTYFGTNIIPSYTASSPSGCLTFVFVSNATQNAEGWDADILCGPPCPSITAVLDSSVPAAGSEDVIRICPGQSVTFNGSGTFAADGTGATYLWNFDDGTTAEGTSATHTFDNEGIYLVNLFITDADGCRNTNLLNQKVYVSTTPNFTGTAPLREEICLGQSTTITGSAAPVEFIRECAPPVSGTTFLPDGSGVSYQTTVPVDCFPFGSQITSASQITSVCIDMEHSFLGDLELRLVSPTGQSVILKAFPGGGGTYLGCPLDGAGDATLGPGTGRTYCFTPTATTLLVNGATSQCGTPNGNSIVAGDYAPVQSFNNLVGSSLNGNWSLIITDNLGIDNGYIFSWSINFDNSILPTDFAFTPELTSQQWVANPTITETNGNVITVTPTAVGQNCYTYQVTDNFGCTYEEEVCINVIPGVELESITAVDEVVCPNEDAVFVLSGTPNTNVTYSINGGSDQVVQIDATGEAQVVIPNVTTETVIQASYIQEVPVPTTGNGISVTGGVNPGNAIGAILPPGTVSNTTNSTTVNAANPTVTITLGNEVPPGTPITISLARSTNAGNISITDGTNTENFNAGPNNLLQHITFTTGQFTDQITFTRINGNTFIDGVAYEFDLLGCDNNISLNANVTVQSPLTPQFNFETTVCSGDVAPILPTTSIEGIEGTWEPSVVSNTVNGTYVFTPNGGQCANGTEVAITITQPATVTFAAVEPLCVNAVYVLPQTSIEGISGTWSPSNVITSSTGIFNFTFTPDDSCANEASLSITVENCEIQKGISPNGDGLNDSFNLEGFNVRELQIFNRYGTIVYNKGNYSNEWFGQSNNGNELPDGTYYYVIILNDQPSKTGWIYINRAR